MSKIELKENLKKYSNLDECPIRNIISRFSGKWPVIILCILSENECTRFNQIQKAIPDISPKVLSQTQKNQQTEHKNTPINKQQEKHFEPPIAGRLLLCPKAITNTTYRFYVVRCFRIFFYFLSQVLNQTVNSVIHFWLRFLIDMLIDLFFREYPIRR